jgi:hypothetical protein
MRTIGIRTERDQGGKGRGGETLIVIYYQITYLLIIRNLSGLLTYHITAYQRITITIVYLVSRWIIQSQDDDYAPTVRRFGPWPIPE